MQTSSWRPLFTLGGLAAALIGAVVGLLLLVAAPAESTAERPPVCAGTGPVQGLSSAQSANAQVVYATAARAGGSAPYIALLAAVTESNLLVLSNPNDPTSTGVPAQGVGFDHDSVGLFQQRPSWGTAAQRMDPQSATNLFLDALVAVPGWDRLDPWVAAQRVQRSAFTGTPNLANHFSAVVGGNYRANTVRASAILASIQTSTAGLDCGGSANLPAYQGDPTTIPSSGGSAAARAAVGFALAQRGKPYLWAGTGPAAFDCSGLMLKAWATAGVTLGRTTTQQIHDGTPTTPAALTPGDLVLVPGSDGTLASPGHVGMYLGGGLVVHAPRTGDVVKVATLASFTAGGVSGYRHIG